ncbi:MAG: PepSY-associated TM helix domain-containing protein [Cyclobacteriaceae bacterium]|nr:PepSY-associated TM helix domain-containing protein [Cyclobacteriaceae bacterium]
MKWRKFNRVIHRDLGYFFFGMAVIYGISGIALNHRDDWNPNYIIRTAEIQLDATLFVQNMSREAVQEVISKLFPDLRMRNHYYPSAETIKVFFREGSVVIDLNNGKSELEVIKRRPVFYEMNFLHYNKPLFLWTWFSDFFGAGLVIMAISGILMLQGKNGLKRRGIWFVAAGILIPLVFLYLYL